MRIQLIRPLSRCSSYDPEVQEPLGIETLAALLRKSGHDVRLYDCMLSARSEIDIACAVAESKPELVGLSLMSDADIRSAQDLIGKIRSQSTSQPVFVAGGSFVSTEPERAASLLPAGTLLIRYEGERPLLRLLGVIEKRVSLDHVPSQTWRSDTRLQASLNLECVSDLDMLPWPARDFADEVIARCGVLNVQGSRGCTGRCTYCCMPGIPQPSSSSWRGRSPESIVEELVYLNKAYGAVAFNFVDDDFLGPAKFAEKRALALAEAILQRNLQIGFGVQLRPNTLTPKTVDALARSGLAYAFIGIENDDPGTLRAWRRRPVNENDWDVIDRLVQQKVDVAAGAILFHPSATLDSVKRFAQTLASRGMLNYRTATSRLHLLPGSRLYMEYSQQRRIPVNAVGPFTPPVDDPRVERLFDYLVRSLAPLRPCWVHAACLLPGYLSQQKAGRRNTDKLRVTRNVLNDMDTWVSEVLSTLIARSYHSRMDSDWHIDATLKSQQIALAACEQLLTAGLLFDPCQLQEAIHSERAI
jgi:hypothetical protein